ncbi:MAG: Fic family protein [Chitinophagaceae bacterium]|nr:MAG: Fic family protein [Chitinophagaceae bacterium]
MEDTLYIIAGKMGRVSGIVNALPANMEMEAVVDLMVAEAIKTSEIEGEYYSRKDVMSSIRNNLGLNHDHVHDKQADGLGQLMVLIRNTYRHPLTVDRIFEWHRLLMQARKGINPGTWRTHSEPMQVVSGSVSNPRVHYEAPPSNRVPAEMEQFLNWFNETAPGGAQEIRKGPIRSAIAHLYFESIHPFEDGNGRIGRAIAEKALSQGLGRPALLSLSKTIETEKKQYYQALESAQRSNEITEWITYFVNAILKAQTDAETQVNFTLQKVKFFDRYLDNLNERQLTVIRKMFEFGPAGFEGGMNAKKYMSIAKTSKATATRDMQDLLVKEAFIHFGNSGGRSTRYQLNIEPQLV